MLAIPALATPVYVQSFSGAGIGNGTFLPQGLAVDSAGNVEVVDYNNATIDKFSSTGTFLGDFGSSGNGNGQFVYPQGIAFDTFGDLYVVDRGNNRVERFNSSGIFQSAWSLPSSALGEGIAIDSSNNVYVAESGLNQVQKYSIAGALQNTWTSGSGGTLSDPVGVAVDPAGNFYVGDYGH
jgi:DNA-binding beta-propeller fold protein YncE